MNIVQTNQGAVDILTDALGGSPDLVVRLFDNAATVNANTVLVDLVEASFAGYAPVSPTWSAPAIVAGVPTTVPSPTHADFNYSGGGTATVYGMYLTDSGNTKLRGVTLFASPFVFTVPIETSFVIVDPEGIVRWAVSPDQVHWRLPDSAGVQAMLVDALSALGRRPAKEHAAQPVTVPRQMSTTRRAV